LFEWAREQRSGRREKSISMGMKTQMTSRSDTSLLPLDLDTLVSKKLRRDDPIPSITVITTGHTSDSENSSLVLQRESERQYRVEGDEYIRQLDKMPNTLDTRPVVPHSCPPISPVIHRGEVRSRIHTARASRLVGFFVLFLRITYVQMHNVEQGGPVYDGACDSYTQNTHQAVHC